MDQQKQEWITQYKIENPNYNWYQIQLIAELQEEENILQESQEENEQHTQNVEKLMHWILQDPKMEHWVQYGSHDVLLEKA